uniref:Uncharacterized protein n=1 Tax=Ditylenchus dipsaci TaxID=166011 RepID=A0A915DYR2_9BILA
MYLLQRKFFGTKKNYPDPTKDGFEQCGMPSKSLVCDVDRMLSESQRADLSSQLIEFENATFHPEGETPCKRKGTTLAIAIVDKISEEMQKQEKLSYFAVFLHAKWTLDDECKKSFIILLPTKNWRFISRDFHYEAPVFFDEFSYIFFREQELFKNASYYEALSNIVQGLKNAIVAKTKELGEEEKVVVQSQPDQQLFSLLDWEHRQNQSWQGWSRCLKKDDQQLLIKHISNFLNNTLAEQNSSSSSPVSTNLTIHDNQHQEHQCPTPGLSITEYLILVGLMCICYVVLSVLWHLLDCLWMLFKTRKSYNVGIKEQKSGKSFHTEERALSTTKLTTAAV